MTSTDPNEAPKPPQPPAATVEEDDKNDPAIATAAPESDAQHPLPEQPPQPAQSAPQQASTAQEQQPELTAHCTTSTIEYDPKGHLTTLNDIPTYISKPSSYPSSPARLLLLLPNGASHTSPNNQKQADLFAEKGYIVILPDQFNGDPAPNITHDADSASQGNNGEQTWIERIKAGLGDVGKSFLIDMWLARHTEVNVRPRILKALEAAKEEFADAVAFGGGVYGVGYCFGAKYILQLLGTEYSAPAQESTTESTSNPTDQNDEEANVAKEPALKAGAIAHGTLVTPSDIEGIKKPIAMVCVERDNLFTDEVREQGKAALELNGVEHDIRVFGGVPHGFAVVGDYKDQTIQQKQEEAFEIMSGWLESH